MAKKEILKNDVATVRVNVEPVVEAAEHIKDEVVEAVSDVVEHIEDAAHTVNVVVRNNPYLIAGVAVVALGVGATAGYFYAQRKLTTKYDTLMQAEVERTKAFYGALSKKGEYSTPEQAVEALGADPVLEDAAEALTTYQGDISEELPIQDVKPKYRKVTEERRNIFTQIPEWDQDQEESMRRADPTAPYVISKEEFLENELEHEQTTITYYKGDDVVADERDGVIEDTSSTVGDDTLLRFGHGSGDPNIVYVRNDMLQHDWEIVFSDGKYARMVLGFDEPEIKHSGRRFRGDRGSGE